MRKTTEQFISEAKVVHKNKYNYSKTEYSGAKNKVIITCPEHGDFQQAAGGHLSGNGCPSCAGKNVSTESFVRNAVSVHGQIFDYSKVKYVRSNKKVKIICPKHGDFEQTPNAHLAGKGCAKCSGKDRTTEEYIAKVKVIHKDKYDYSNTNFLNNISKIKIICPEHGEFQQSAGGHLYGKGCPKCSRNQKKTTSEFIIDAAIKHNEKYDYSKVKYEGAQTKIKIICPEHGEFMQTPTHHYKVKGVLLAQETKRKTQKYLFRMQKKYMETSMIILKQITNQHFRRS